MDGALFEYIWFVSSAPKSLNRSHVLQRNLELVLTLAPDLSPPGVR